MHTRLEDLVFVIHPNKENREDSKENGGARGVMVVVVGNGHDDTSSSPGRDWLHFT